MRLKNYTYVSRLFLFLFAFSCLAPLFNVNAQDQSPIVVTADQPNIWMLEEAHYLSRAQIPRRNPELRAADAGYPDPNEINGVNVLKTLFAASLRYDRAVFPVRPQPIKAADDKSNCKDCEFGLKKLDILIDRLSSLIGLLEEFEEKVQEALPEHNDPLEDKYQNLKADLELALKNAKAAAGLGQSIYQNPDAKEPEKQLAIKRFKDMFGYTLYLANSAVKSFPDLLDEKRGLIQLIEEKKAEVLANAANQGTTTGKKENKEKAEAEKNKLAKTLAELAKNFDDRKKKIGNVFQELGKNAANLKGEDLRNTNLAWLKLTIPKDINDLGRLGQEIDKGLDMIESDDERVKMEGEFLSTAVAEKEPKTVSDYRVDLRKFSIKLIKYVWAKPKPGSKEELLSCDITLIGPTEEFNADIGELVKIDKEKYTLTIEKSKLPVFVTFDNGKNLRFSLAILAPELPKAPAKQPTTKP